MNYSASYPSGFAVRPFKNHPQLGGGWVDDGFGHRLIRVVGLDVAGRAERRVGLATTCRRARSPPSTVGELAYRLQAEPQSLWNPSTLTVQVTAPAGWTPVPQAGMEVQDSTATVSAVQSAPVDVAHAASSGDA